MSEKVSSLQKMSSGSTAPVSKQAVTYQSLFFAIGEVAASICSMKITEEPNQHGKISIVVILDSMKKEKVLHESKSVFSIFYVDKSAEAVPLFQGLISYLEIQTEGDVFYMSVEAQTISATLDFVRCSKSFQDVTMSSHSLVKQILGESAGKSILNFPNKSTSELVLQYEETDWEFLKRFVSRYGALVFPNSSDLSMKLQIGLSQEIRTAAWDKLDFTVIHDMETLHYRKENGGRDSLSSNQTGRQKDFIRYEVTSYDIVPLGSKVIFHGKELYIGRIVRALSGGLLANTYTLYTAADLTCLRYYNERLTGASIHGIIMGVSRNRVQVMLQIDQEIPGNPYWFPFSTVAASSDGSGWYCMPKEGDQVRVFFPEHNEKESYAITSIEGHNPETPAQDDPMGNPNSKNLSTPDGNNVKFTEDGILLSTDNGSVLLTNDGTITMEAAQNISLWGGEAVKIITEGGSLLLTADSKVSVSSDAGGSITVEAAEIEINGTQIHQNLPGA